MSTSFHIQTAHLRVANLNLSRIFYSTLLGLEGTQTDSRTLELYSPGEKETPLLVLKLDPHIQPKQSGAPGLFHLALLLPDRRSLAGIMLKLSEVDLPLHGMADHGVSEAIYLSDPDGHGLEFYADKPRTEWPSHEGELVMYTLPLNTQNLLETLPSRISQKLPEGTRIGHVHLQTASLEESEKFYTEALGLSVSSRMPGAVFYAADGYHHHLATNVWGKPKPKAPNQADLERLQIAVKGVATQTLSSPDGLQIELTGS